MTAESTQVREPVPRTFAPYRLVAFSDGVFAIAITLLILPLADLVIDSDLVAAQLWGAVPEMITFVVGFVVIGLYWLSHHAWFSRVRRVDDRLLKINLALLMCVVFLPFPTAVLGRHAGTAGTVFYAASVSLTGFAFAATWAYLLRHPELLEEGSATVLARHTQVGLVAPIVFALSIPVALLTPDGAKLVWLLLWPGSVVASRVAARRRGSRLG